MKNLYLLLLFLPLGVVAQTLYFIDKTVDLPLTTGPSMDVQAADLDGDGDLDIVLAGEFQPNILLFNDGLGHFVNATAGRLPQPSHDSEDIAIADYDLDGDLDIVFISEDNAVHEMYLNDGSGTFANASSRLPNSVANAVLAADVNADGYPDLIIGNAGQNTVLINDSTGHFRDETASRLPSINDVTQDLLLLDIEGDGDLDLFVGNEDNNRILLNDSTGHFTDVTAFRIAQDNRMETRKASAADVDGDGDLDLFLSNVAFKAGKNSRDKLYLNNGSGFFTDRSSFFSVQRTEHTLDGIFMDIDLDGDHDLVTVAILNQPPTVWFNDGTGHFADSSAAALPAFGLLGEGLGVIHFDADADGLQDLYICNRGQADHLLIRNPLLTSIKDNNLICFPIKIISNFKENNIKLISEFKIYKKLTVSILDSQGRTIISPFTYTPPKGKQQHAIPMNGIRSGIYFVRVQSGKMVQTFQIAWYR